MDYTLSVNHYICGDDVAFPQFAEMVSAAGIEQVGVTRAALFEMGVPALAQCLRDNGLGVSSISSVGYFTGTRPETKDNFTDDEMIDIAAELGAEALTVITGGVSDPSQPAAEAYERIKSGLAEMAPLAEAKGVVLGLEPLHPNYFLTLGCINTIAHGLELIKPHANAKLLLDVDLSWWDPDLAGVLREEPEEVVLIQMCNVKVENNRAAGRETLAAGDLDMSRLIGDFLAGGFRGTFEFELFPGDLRGRDLRSLIDGYAQEFADCVAA
ncbi:MAG: sugar phosphate isomerase/epimerase [Alphaproteobacteria bacterium]|nr:sugar phosphate isomerase/epimerase [Alphaproteobacteria bacterium]